MEETAAPCENHQLAIGKWQPPHALVGENHQLAIGQWQPPHALVGENHQLAIGQWQPPHALEGFESGQCKETALNVLDHSANRTGPCWLIILLFSVYVTPKWLTILFCCCRCQEEVADIQISMHAQYKHHLLFILYKYQLYNEHNQYIRMQVMLLPHSVSLPSKMSSRFPSIASDTEESLTAPRRIQS